MANAAGFTYLGVLLLVLLIGLALGAAGEVASTAARREREQELLYAGHQYREAIRRFYVQLHRFPEALDELTGMDTGGSTSTRFIRRLYRDPMTPGGEWTLIPAPQGGILGVASASHDTPLKRVGFDAEDAGFEEAEDYAGWTFVPVVRAARVPVRAPSSPAAQP